MKTSRPLLRGEFSFQEFTTDYDELIDFFHELDEIVTDPALDVIKSFEKEREVTIELWSKKQYKKRDENNPNIRLANLFEVCAFANRFPRAHIEHGEYCGFDSVAGRVMSDHYCPTICSVWVDYGSGLYISNPKKESLPPYRLVVTKEKLL